MHSMLPWKEVTYCSNVAHTLLVGCVGSVVSLADQLTFNKLLKMRCTSAQHSYKIFVLLTMVSLSPGGLVSHHWSPCRKESAARSSSFAPVKKVF